MAYIIKTKKSKQKVENENIKAYNYESAYEDLDDTAYIEYGTRYGDLDEKSKKEIALKLVRERAL